MNLADTFVENARSRPDHPAIEDGERVVSYAELEALANTAAANLINEGIKPGDIIGLALPESVEYAALLWAIAKVGAVIFLINVPLVRSEREVELGGHRLKAVIVASDFPSLPSGARVILLEVIFAKCPEAAMPVIPTALGDQHPLFCVHSSGTTGTPKTFMTSHIQAAGLLHDSEKYLRWTSEDRHVTLVGMGFYSGCRLCLAAQSLGATIVINRARSVEELVQLVREKELRRSL